MNKTKQYRLNQWDMSDRIEMKDFNADNAAIEAALAALAAEGSRIDAALTAEGSRQSAALAAEGSRLDAAIAAVKSELSNAIAAETKRVNAELAKKALASDLTAEASRLDSGKLAFATLLDTSFTASGSSYSITVPGSEMGKCTVAAAVLSSSTLTNSSLIYANTGSNSYHRILSTTSLGNGLMQFYKDRIHLAIFFPMKQASLPIHGVSFAEQTLGLFYSAVTYSSLTSLTIKPPSGTSTLSGSGTLRIYGIR